MILREIKNIFIKNRLTEGVDFVRKEWLKGDNTAKIEWTANLWNNQLHTIVGKVKKGFIASRFELPNPTSSAFQVAYNSSTYLHGVDHLMVIFRSESNPYHIADIVPFSAMPDVVDFKFYINNNVGYCKTNNTLYTGHSMATVWNDNVKFAVLAGKMKLLEEYDYVNDKLISSLVPCQLLKSIPSSLDANNIARQAGECGMYDSISGKFYGNVANSGTFTVEGEVKGENNSGLQQIYQNRLIEGVDYETADWLKYTNWSKPEGENALLGAYLICNLKVTTILNFTIKLGETIHDISNVDVELIVRSSTRIYYIRRNYRNNSVYLYDSASTVISGPRNLGSELDFSITDEGLFINGVHLISEQIKYIDRFGNQARSCTGSISGITTEEGADVLVPCQLLRSIPRNLDAQCKERVAGECGMVDLISGKFYGNVADSGTFTVENDTENNE